jgi:hypothetical protein
MEALTLQGILQTNCACVFDQETGARTQTCAPHQMLAEDQRALDGLVFARRMAACWKRKEFSQR